jgi:hypothetical protein
MAEFSVTGGMRVGWLHATWPFARLTVSETGLRLSGLMSGSYSFAPGEVVSLDRIGIPFLSSAIQIVHNRADYPSKIIFWGIGSTEDLLARIRETGFTGTALAAGRAVWHQPPDCDTSLGARVVQEATKKAGAETVLIST